VSEGCSSLFDDVSVVGRYTWISNYTGCVVGDFVVLDGLATAAERKQISREEFARARAFRTFSIVGVNRVKHTAAAENIHPSRGRGS
jgi:hypothetical protein